jgi:hypothetical protein
MDKEVRRTYELFLGNWIPNRGRIAKVVKYRYQVCGPSCETGIKGQGIILCERCKHPKGHNCYIDYRTGYTIERGDPRMEAYFEAENNVLLQKEAEQRT